MQKPTLLKTLILDVVFPEVSIVQAEERLEELQNLIQTVGGIVVEKIIQRRGRPSVKTFLGSGKIKEAADFVKENNLDLVIINGMLKPNQYLHMQDIFPGKHLWDRTDLILNIFDKHATSKLAQLQIKLARLHHEIPKIYSRQATTLFERAGAGIGTRGAGEKGIEDEKRHIRAQIKQIEEKIEAAQKVQKNQRLNRDRTGMPTIALVGYTNAGKSSLMKILTRKADIVASNALFTTLDTKIGTTWLPHLQKEVMIADTIGFISDLPPLLIQSFMTTLQEAQMANLLLHVIDISDERYLEKIQIVDEILKNIGCDEIPQMYVCNKIENAQSAFDPDEFTRQYAAYTPVFISCHEKIGIETLKDRIEFREKDVVIDVESVFLRE